MTPSVDSTHRGEWFALLFHVISVMITFHVIVEIQLKELHDWYIAYLQLRTSVVYLFKTNEPLKWWLLFFVKRQISFKMFDEIGIPGRADSFEFEVVDIWKSCMWTAEWRKIIAANFIYTSFAVAKRKPEKKNLNLFQAFFCRLQKLRI